MLTDSVCARSSASTARARRVRARLLACFVAHEDKISGQCQYALYNASAQLEQAVAALSYAATECEQDILAHCGDVYVGEGRVLECLESKGEAVSEACRTAMSDVFE